MANDRAVVAPFSSEFLYWVGQSVRSTDPTVLATFNWFYDETHLPEVFAANPGVVGAGRYELITQDPRGEFAPPYLAVYELADDSAKLADGPSSLPPIWPDLVETRWRMRYRRLAGVGDPTEPASSILAIAMDPPADAGPAELAEFDDFYTRVHLPKVVADSRFLRGTRYELCGPAAGGPRYLAVYEADARKTAEHVRWRTAGRMKTVAEPAEGPSAWRNRTTAWRAYFRRTTTR